MVTVRRATPADARTLAKLHAETVAVAYADIFPADAPAPTPDVLAPGYRSLLGDPQAEVWIASTDAVIVGAIALVVDTQVPARLRIERFNVHPDHQVQGVGGRLYRKVLQQAQERGVSSLNLWVLQDNARARSIYEAWGWTLVPGFVLANEPPDVLDVLYELKLSRRAGAVTS